MCSYKFNEDDLVQHVRSKHLTDTGMHKNSFKTW